MQDEEGEEGDEDDDGDDDDDDLDDDHERVGRGEAFLERMGAFVQEADDPDEDEDEDEEDDEDEGDDRVEGGAFPCRAAPASCAHGQATELIVMLRCLV